MATDRLGDMRLVVEAAGRKLGFSPAAASARLAKLEAVLQTRLFDRGTWQLRLTEEGRLYLRHCAVALQRRSMIPKRAACESRRGAGQSADFSIDRLRPPFAE